MSAARAPRQRVVVDGSNLATEGRTVPSLHQLDDVVKSFVDENPKAEVIVVVDATFEHRVSTSDRAKFKDAELAGEIVTPPAGAIGRGDAFILKIAARIDAIVLSNDSFQEFQEEHPWLFQPGRLIGGKPVPSVGWVFTERLPVRGTKSPRAVKKLTVALPNGAAPSIGATITPAKAPKVTRVAKSKPTKVPTKVAAKVAGKVAKSDPPAKAAVTPKKTLAKKILVKKAAKTTKSAAKTSNVVVEPAVALRRGRQPVNPESVFMSFVGAHRIRSHVQGEVIAFTSHGAIIGVVLADGQRVECYAPTTALGSPPPARARDALKRGDQRDFRLTSVDRERRIAEVSIA